MELEKYNSDQSIQTGLRIEFDLYKILPSNLFKGLAIGLQCHCHLSGRNLIINMNKTEAILLKFCSELSLYYTAILNMHISKRFMKQSLFR